MRKLPLIASLLTLFAANVFAAPNPMDVGVNINNPDAVLNYWTAERMRDAKPMPLPTVDPKHLKEEKIPAYDAASQLSVPGTPPSVKVKPNLRHIPGFMPQSNNGITPQDHGTMNAYFSSTRLVPTNADLAYPYSAVGQLFFSNASGGNYVCSASVIGKRVLVTAGHCVHAGSGGQAGYYRNFMFVPARHADQEPFGEWAISYVKTTTAWMTGNGGVPNAGDFALMEAKDHVTGKAIGDVVGKLGYATRGLIPNHLNMLGYPCNFDNCSLMHQVTAQSQKPIVPNNAQYGSDMRGGSSGGPWVQNFGEKAVGQTTANFNQVVGVTSWGYVAQEPKVQGASNFDQTFVALINEFCARKPDNC